MLVFIRIFGFVAYYPTYSCSLDLLNHNSRFPCTNYCFMRRTKGLRSKYSYTNSKFSSACGISRTIALRHDGMCDMTERNIGMTKCGRFELLKNGSALH